MAMESKLTQEEKFAQLEKAKPIPPNKCPKIQRIAPYLRKRKSYTDNCFPRMVSIGPIHHGEKNLMLGEQYKLMWARKYIKRTNQTAATLLQKIVDKIKQLKGLFTEDAIENFDDHEELSWMLFVDGCSVLQILDKFEEGMNLKTDQEILVMQDLFLLENQLPFQVLHLLSGDEDMTKLMETIDKFVHRNNLLCKPEIDAKQDVRQKKQKDQDPTEDDQPPECKLGVQDQVPPPTHLLDHLRSTMLRDCHNKEANEKNQNLNDSGEKNVRTTYKNLLELKEAGIRVKANKSRRLRDISFSPSWFAAELKLPQIMMDDSTAPTLINLVAYEMCPDFHNDYGISSFVAFLDTLIDNSDDVKELRSAGVLVNYLGSDEEVAQFFNDVNAGLFENLDIHGHIVDKIEMHYKNKYKTWIAQGYHTYFSNPWSILAFHAAVLVLVLTFIQTWFAVYPATNN